MWVLDVELNGWMIFIGWCRVNRNLISQDSQDRCWQLTQIVSRIRLLIGAHSSDLAPHQPVAFMTDPTVPISPKEVRFGGLSFFFLAVGVVGPFLNTLAVAIVPTTKRLSAVDPVVIAMGLRAVFLVIALVFGILGRRTRPGRIGLIGSGAVLAIAFVFFLVHFFQPAVVPVEPARVSLPPP